MERIHGKYLFSRDVNWDKMIFLSGPRQIGKTTFVKNHLEKIKQADFYYNWDDPFVLKRYRQNPHFLKAPIASQRTKPLVAFDEIHKHRNWKNILKGLYDIHHHEAQFIVTGSARLDYFRQSGDSLVGRYFSFRMFPLGLSEATGQMDPIIHDDSYFSQDSSDEFVARLRAMKVPENKEAFDALAVFGGFPEPFLKSSQRFSNKWRHDYKSLLLYEDLRDMTRITDIKGVEQLTLLLPERVASPLSVNSLREDLAATHKTVLNWIESLKKIYLVFSIRPWSQNIARAIKKEKKVYFFDWTHIPDKGKKFENMLAVSLARLVCHWNELGIADFELCYVRNAQKKEVDFLIVKDRNPYVLIEAKSAMTTPSKSGVYFQKMLNIPFFQIVADYHDVEVFPNQTFIIGAPLFFGLIG
ncbi:ATPase AAA [Candidatus Desulfarcum epimagneticum]|uniref:ATPase AAA n=1 Tax=uncultured Desulfobacteraceae bacterium TaxID=218296 RepID=A0A484HJF2_9BACT|nr:ATPase AAA [uncultured Desulfobacteraceae bacterium]